MRRVRSPQSLAISARSMPDVTRLRCSAACRTGSMMVSACSDVSLPAVSARAMARVSTTEPSYHRYSRGRTAGPCDSSTVRGGEVAPRSRHRPHRRRPRSGERAGARRRDWRLWRRAAVVGDEPDPLPGAADGRDGRHGVRRGMHRPSGGELEPASTTAPANEENHAEMAGNNHPPAGSTRLRDSRRRHGQARSVSVVPN